jgi:hypothetical protein
MAGFTNKGKFRMAEAYLRAVATPTNLYMALVTSVNVPDADTNTLGDLTEITAGNGYTTGGYQLTPGATDFDVCNEDDVNDLAHVEIKDIAWVASGGSIPSAGNGARYAVLIDDNATVSLREVLAYFDLVSDRTISVGQTLTLQDCTLEAKES